MNTAVNINDSVPSTTVMVTVHVLGTRWFALRLKCLQCVLVVARWVAPRNIHVELNLDAGNPDSSPSNQQGMSDAI